MLRFDVHGCTDVTGFGLMGHAREMALASSVTLEIDPSSAVSARRRRVCAPGAIPGGLKNNREFASCVVETRREIPREIEDLLYDPQTSGGLLISLAEADAGRLEQALKGAYRIGRVWSAAQKAIHLI